MKTVQAVIDISEDLYLSLSCFGLTREKIVNESRKLLARKYFQEKLLSMGKAAEFSGLSKWDLVVLHKVVVYNMKQILRKRE